MKRRRVAVIGAGLGGLAASIRLASRGHEVHLFEQQEQPGGKAGTLSLDGFRFDTGPSIFTMRPVFEELFEAAGERLDASLELVPLDPICTYFYPDGSLLRAWANPSRLAREIAEQTEDGEESVMAHLDYCRRIYESAGELFLRHSLHNLSTYLTPAALRGFCRPWRIDPFRSVDAANSRRFRDPRTVQLFNRYATYNGSDPFRAPATLNLIPYVEHCLGTYGVQGGTYRIVEALVSLAARKGVHFHYGARVDRIELDGRRVCGISAAGRTTPFQVVVSDVDVTALHRLLDGRTRHPNGSGTPSSSAVVFLWAIDRPFIGLGPHSVFFSSDYRREFCDIFDRGVAPRDPTVYVHISSKITPTDAPPGCENWFVMVNAPAASGQDWPRQVERLRETVLRRLSQALGVPVRNAIRSERVFTPPEFERATGSHRGSLYGNASNSPAAAFRRHPNRVPGVRGLYACGGSTHPGGGMPLVLLSAKIATELVDRYER